MRDDSDQFDRTHRFMSKFFVGWFIFCLILALAMIAGFVWLAIELIPHLTGALDRSGQ